MIQAHEGEGEFVVVDTELVQDGSVEVADPDFVFDDIVAVIVGFSVGHATFDAAAGHPGREAFRVVVAAVLVAFEFALTVGGAAKLTGEDDEGFVEHAALFKVFNETGAGLVDIVSLAADFLGKCGVVIPTPVEQLDKADAAFGHASGEETVASEGSGLLHFGSVKFFVLGFVFAGEVGELGNAGLHPESHLLLCDGCLNFRVADSGHMLFVELGNEVEHLVPGFPVDPFGVGEEEDGVAGGLEGNALVF